MMVLSLGCKIQQQCSRLHGSNASVPLGLDIGNW
jgi:hypothetical protein